jgi:hypothetical protein
MNDTILVSCCVVAGIAVAIDGICYLMVAVGLVKSVWRFFARGG